MPPHPVADLERLLNTSAGGTSSTSSTPDFTVTRYRDLASARQAVIDGDASAALGIERSTGGELAFTLYSEDVAPGIERTAVFATTSLAIADRLDRLPGGPGASGRLDRLGVAQAAQAGLFAPANLEIAWPDPEHAGSGPVAGQTGTDYLLGFG